MKRKNVAMENAYDFSNMPANMPASIDQKIFVGMGVLGGVFATIFVISMLALTALMIVSMWKIFEKAGKPGWKSLIPVYNIVVLFKLVGLNPWLILIYFSVVIPFFGAVAAFILNIFLSIRLAKAFGQEGAFAAGLIFLPCIFYPILGFGKSKYALVADKPADPMPQNPISQDPAPIETAPENTEVSEPQS